MSPSRTLLFWNDTEPSAYRCISLAAAVLERADCSLQVSWNHVSTQRIAIDVTLYIGHSSIVNVHTSEVMQSFNHEDIMCVYSCNSD